MQYRMKTHILSEEKINNLLSTAQTGSLATVNEDGTPYVTPVHFVHLDHKIYIHGLPKGKKIDNIIRNRNVSFVVYDMQDLLLDPEGKPCDTNTKYESVIIAGVAVLLEDVAGKRAVLHEVVKKYTPHLADAILPEGMIRGTAVISIEISEITGKYYD